ncbi:hypothetical protein WSK_3958 [Novosphingobium sp. Rr 2-17]|uniref:hypothetical protein n=1 Tax=Novosphingobium sp. Rr 2-17 TaxID=555793 RepID=UPI000269957E|nr:hypothetical protein [Novosphingobium sp. Rr 2-17]EIZ77575.1 hypothetical protein WSK_3958 [Novosphingobium sp. Rr 2-17]
MSRTPAAFRQADVARAVKAVRAAKMPITGVEIAPDGTIRVLTSPAAETPTSPFDAWKQKRQ